MVRETKHALTVAVEAAVWAPSVHNSQPWSFAITDDEISVRADSDRKLRTGDASGRELFISCGAALFNLRMALRCQGFEPVVRVLPDPDRPSLIAIVRPGAEVEPDEHTKLLHAEIERRRTHRAGFTTLPVPDKLLDALAKQATFESATFTPVASPAAVKVLAGLTSVAQAVQSQEQAFTLEMLRWARPPDSPRKDGVPAEAYPKTVNTAFDQRDYAQGRPWGNDADQAMSVATGRLTLLTTVGDDSEHWIAAGQALQRVLLHASAFGVSAAFHTQTLELPSLREFLRTELCSGRHPQMVMRLGFTFDETQGVRRPLSDVLE